MCVYGGRGNGGNGERRVLWLPSVRRQYPAPYVEDVVSDTEWLDLQD